MCVIARNQKMQQKIAKTREREIQRENDRLGFLILNGKLIKCISAIEEECDGHLVRQSHTVEDN